MPPKKRKPIPRPEQPKKFDAALNSFLRINLERLGEIDGLKKEIIERVETEKAYTRADIANLRGHISKANK